jgi:hypothetical protein
MLANLDVVIGLSVVMLGLSLIVTMVGQALSNAMAVRGTNLKWGLATLVQELHPQRFTRPSGKLPMFGGDLNKQAADVVTKVLTHPLVSDSKLPLFEKWKLTTVIRFDEFVKTVAMLSRATHADEDVKWLSENSHITEPWFNTVMDRVSQRFTMHMRVYTVLISMLLVLALHVDTLHIVKTLRSDAALRSGFVSGAEQIVKSGGVTDDADAEKVKQFAKTVIGQLPQDQNIMALLHASPRSIGDAPGLLISMMLLSLGAPFWFNALKNLTALRPIIARKEEQERSASTGSPDVGDRIKWKDL